MKAHLLLKQNVDALLRARGQNRKDLAMWCRKDESWLSHIMRSPVRGFALKYLDRIADFFGVATYQLLQPGIGPLTERRKLRDRRSGHDRRVGHAHRLMLETAPHIESLRRVTSTGPSAKEAELLNAIRALPPKAYEAVSTLIHEASLATEISPAPHKRRPSSHKNAV